MAAIRALEVISAKWARVTPQRVQDYTDGVRSPRTSWSAATAGAQAVWEAGIQASVASKSFSKGATKAGNAKWEKGAIEKGTVRYGPGVQIAESDYNRGFAPYRQAIAAVQLPPRFARRDPRNLARVSAVVDALVKTKAAQVG